MIQAKAWITKKKILALAERLADLDRLLGALERRLEAIGGA